MSLAFACTIYVVQSYVSAHYYRDQNNVCLLCFLFSLGSAQVATWRICKNKRMLAGSVEVKRIWVSGS